MIAETPESEQRAALGDEKEIVRLANEIKRRKREARRAELEAQRRTESDADSWRGEPEWTDEERGLLKQLRAGDTIIVSYRQHPALIDHCENAGLLVRVDRRTPWGNPFEMPDDGDRETVIAKYRGHYLPHKPTLLAQLGTLRGKALACWCAPLPCHSDVLRDAALAERAPAPAPARRRARERAGRDPWGDQIPAASRP